MAKKPKTPSKKPDEADPKDPDDGVDPEDDDPEDDEAERAAENQRINAIVTSRVRREMKTVNSTLTALQETLAKLVEGKKPSDPEDDEDPETGEQPTGKKPPAEDPKLVRKMSKLEKELADERAARKEAEKQRQEEQEKGKRTEMRNVFSSHLTELGITDPKLLRAALNVLEEDGIMVRTETGKIAFKGVDKYGIETEFDPKIGLKSWVAGDGKSFVPAIDAGGSGTGGARGTGNGTQALSARDVQKMSPQQLASINLERACSGLPPLGEDK